MRLTERSAMRLVACFEAFKGVLVLLAASGLLSLLHKDIEAIAVRLIEHMHLNPASKYATIFLDAAARLQDSRLVMLALGAAAYATIRLVEGWGLYRERAWAEVLAAASGAIYMPIEVYGWFKHPTWFRFAVFVVNAAVVGIMWRALAKRKPKPEATPLRSEVSKER